MINIKKLSVPFMSVLLCSCQNPTYSYTSQNLGDNLSGKKVYIIDAGTSIANSKLEKTLEQILLAANTKPQLMSSVLQQKRIAQPDYVAIGSIKRASFQQNRSVPVWGQTGINSIQTTSNTTSTGNLYGNYDVLTQYGYNSSNTSGNLYGNYTSNAATTTNTNVNYNYGITGYRNVVETHYLTCAFIDIKKYSPSLTLSQMKPVHESQVCVDDYANDDEFLSHVQAIYSQNPLFIDSKKQYTCDFNGYGSSCRPQ